MTKFVGECDGQEEPNSLFYADRPFRIFAHRRFMIESRKILKFLDRRYQSCSIIFARQEGKAQKRLKEATKVDELSVRMYSVRY